MDEENKNLENQEESGEQGEFPIDAEIGNDDSEEEIGEATMAKAGSTTLRKKSTSADFSDFDDGEGQLTIDVFQTPTEIIIESPIAGVNPEDLDINITSESVTIKGRREKEKTIKEEDYFYQECYWGRFSRSIILPQEVDAEEAKANLKNGVLTIRLPKINRQKIKKLNVKFD
ncbi:MAG: Hsp20/alpha crystallin family protein [bacterium]|nr:Hsp20/alpha crystallin family protein [bacterium]